MIYSLQFVSTNTQFQVVSENLQANKCSGMESMHHLQLQRFSISDSSEKALIEYLFLCCKIQKILTAIKLSTEAKRNGELRQLSG